MEKAQDFAELKKEVRSFGEALKFNNSRMLDLQRLAEAQFNRKLADVSKVENIERRLVVFGPILAS